MLDHIAREVGLKKELSKYGFRTHEPERGRDNLEQLGPLKLTKSVPSAEHFSRPSQLLIATFA